MENILADRRRSPLEPVHNAPSLLRGINFRVLDPLSISPSDLRCCSRGVFRFLVSYPFYGDYMAFSSPFDMVCNLIGEFLALSIYYHPIPSLIVSFLGSLDAL